MSFITGFAAGVGSLLLLEAVLIYLFKDYVIGYLVEYGQRQMQQQMLGGDGLEDMMEELGDAFGGEQS